MLRAKANRTDDLILHISIGQVEGIDGAGTTTEDYLLEDGRPSLIGISKSTDIIDRHKFFSLVFKSSLRGLREMTS